MLNMNEKISTLMDGELERDEAMQAIRQLGHDANRRDLWDQYHLIGEVLRGESTGEIARRKKSADSIFARLSIEPTVLVPAAMKTIPVEKKTRMALALAASVVTVSAIAVMALKLQADSSAPEPAQMAQSIQAAQPGAQLVDATQIFSEASTADAVALEVVPSPKLLASSADELRVNDYLAIHRQFASQSGFQAASVQIELPRKLQQTQQAQQPQQAR